MAARSLTTPDRVMLLMTLVAYLQEHGPTSVAELAERFSVEPRVLRRLVQFLGTAGVPGETRTYQHEDLFDLDWDAFEQHDVVSLTRVVAVDDTPRFSNAETAALLAGLHVLTPMLPVDLHNTARRTAEKLGSIWTVAAGERIGSLAEAPLSADSDPATEVLASITDAMRGGNRLAFQYRDGSGMLSARLVEPLLLEQTTGGWYLRAYCLDRQAERTFLVDRMREIVPRHDAAERQALPASSLLDISGAEVNALVTVRESALHRIADFAPTLLGPAAPGWVRLEVELMHPQVAVRLVQAAPGEVVVEAPAEARAAVRAWADRALAQYGDETE